MMMSEAMRFSKPGKYLMRDGGQAVIQGIHPDGMAGFHITSNGRGYGWRWNLDGTSQKAKPARDLVGEWPESDQPTRESVG